MSGGSYDYAYSKIDEVLCHAETLREMAACCDKWAANEAGTKLVGGKHLPLTTHDRATMLVAAMRLRAAADKVTKAHEALVGVRDLMRTVEWITSGDYAPDDLLDEKKV